MFAQAGQALSGMPLKSFSCRIASGKMEFEHEGSATLNHLRREFIAGGVAGAIGVFIGFPFDLIKVKLQAFPMKYTNAMDCLRQSVKSDGWLGLYNGCLPPIAFQGTSTYIRPDLLYSILIETCFFRSYQ